MSGFGKLIIVASLVVWGVFFLVSRGCSCTEKWKAYVYATKSDLRNLTELQTQKYARDSAYGADLDSLGFRPSTGVTIEITEAGRAGWAAVARHRENVGACYVAVGQVRSRPAVLPDTVPYDQSRCDMRKPRMFERRER